MTRLRIALALAVVGITLVVAGAALWQFTGSPATDRATTASAAVQFALDNACGGNRERYYDTVTSYMPIGEDGSPIGTYVYEQSYDGDDSDGRYSVPLYEGGHRIYIIIAKGDKVYARWDDAPPGWEVSDRSAASNAFHVCQPQVQGSANSRSPNATVESLVQNIRPANYQYEGELLLEGIRLRHYVRSEGAAGSSDPPTPTPTAATFREAFGGADLRQLLDEVWIDSSGRIFRMDSRIILPFNGVIRVSTKFSGYGEPNTITAPTLPTPTPTPTPPPTTP